MSVKTEPIQIQFIVSRRASSISRQRMRYLRKIAERNGTIQLQLSVTSKNENGFEAMVRFKDDAPCEEPDTVVISEPRKIPLATEQEIRSHALAISKNALFSSLEPAKRIWVLMNRLDKAVRLKTLVSSCQDILKLNYDTIRGTLNKNGYGHCKDPLYFSPERGIWCAVGIAEREGIMI